MLNKKTRLVTLSKELEQIRVKIAQNKEQVRVFQQKKQEDMWRFIKLAVRYSWLRIFLYASRNKAIAMSSKKKTNFEIVKMVVCVDYGNKNMKF